MQRLLLVVLSFFSRLILRVHKPYIIGITGTVGKTTVTSHVYRFLKQAFPQENIGYSPDHYNGEYGLPLTIIGTRTGGKNPLKWIGVFLIAFSQLFRPYPKYLVLEYGIDHPGEMDFLLSIAMPDIAIITEIAPNHLEQFGTFEAYKQEKIKITKRSKNIIAHETLRDDMEENATFYGIGSMSDIFATDINLSFSGTQGTVHFGDHTFPIFLEVLGAFHIINILPLYKIAEILKGDVTKISSYAQHAKSEPGRATLIDGIAGSRIIDGSYNGGYLSIHAGITSMRAFAHTHHVIFLLGDMRELGSETEKLHHQIANDILDTFSIEPEKISVYLVGKSMMEYVFPKLQDTFFTQAYLSSREAGKAIKDYLLGSNQSDHTLIYVKGSQNTIFLEEAIEKILLSSEDAKKLCRQSETWKKKKEDFFQSLSA